MNRRIRICIVVLLAPLMATVVLAVLALGGLALAGVYFAREQVVAGLTFHYLGWLLLAFWWAWRNWKGPYFSRRK